MSAALAGIREVKPLKGFPPGKIRIRLREEDLVRVYVWRKQRGIKEFLVKEVEGHWVPYLQVGENFK